MCNSDDNDDPKRALGAERRGTPQRRRLIKKREKLRRRRARPVRDLENPSARATLTEALDIENWMDELRREGFTEFYARPIREGPRAGELPRGARAFGGDEFGQLLRKVYPSGGPDLVAMNPAGKKILVGDVTAGEWSRATVRTSPGQMHLQPAELRHEAEQVHHLVKTKRDADRLFAHLPDGYMDYEVHFQDRYSESKTKASRRFRALPGSRGTGRRPSDVDRSLTGGEPSRRSSRKPVLPKARVLERKAGTLAGATRRLKAGSLLIGRNAWRTFRVVGSFAITLFVPLKALDVVFEIALALWDREREKEERRRREKQSALAEVFKQKEERIQQLIESKVLGADAQQQLINNWDRNHVLPGFLYARISATLEIQAYHHMANSEIEGPTSVKVIDVDVLPNSAFFDFELTGIGEDRAADQTDADRKMLFDRKVVFPEMLQKIIKRRWLKYTIVPPLVTPFDIVVTKINNLFMDTVLFVASFEGIGNEIFGDSFRFDYKSTYDAQLVFDLQFPEPLKASTCHFCLGYLHWAAKVLSQHPLTEQDIQGNLEDPVKGWKRRHGLLLSLVEGRGTTYGKNFSYLTDRMRELISRDKLDPDAESAVNELHAGSRAIWADLQRIERNVGRPEYFYYGPNYRVPKF